MGKFVPGGIFCGTSLGGANLVRVSEKGKKNGRTIGGGNKKKCRVGGVSATLNQKKELTTKNYEKEECELAFCSTAKEQMLFSSPSAGFIPGTLMNSEPHAEGKKKGSWRRERFCTMMFL